MNLESDIEQIVRQEDGLQLERFDPSLAWELGSILRRLATERALPVVIDVRRIGQPLFYTALEATTPDNAEWVRRKNNILARYHRSSYRVGLEMNRKGETLEQRGLPVADYAAHGGAFPLAVRGAGLVGSATVSGLPQRQDHELVVEALCLLTGKPYAAFRLED